MRPIIDGFFSGELPSQTNPIRTPLTGWVSVSWRGEPTLSSLGVTLNLELKMFQHRAESDNRQVTQSRHNSQEGGEKNAE